MLKLYVKARTWMDRDEGATAVEYGIMVALIAVVIIGAVLLLGQELDRVFRAVVTAIP